MKWCKDVHNVLSMRKLGWRTPKEVLMGNTPDMSMFKFHVWEDVCCLDPDTKQPKHNMLLGNFLGIAWNYGDSLCYFIRTKPSDKSKRPQELARSVVRKYSEVENATLTNPDSDKAMLHVDKGLPLTSILKENNESKPYLDPDDASVNTVTTMASSDVQSDLDGLDLNVVLNDDIEVETLPINMTGSERGRVKAYPTHLLQKMGRMKMRWVWDLCRKRYSQSWTILSQRTLI